MQVSSSAYYGWRDRQNQPPAAEEANQAEQVKECFKRHRRRYGSRRITAELQSKGTRIGRYKVRRLMREQKLTAICPKAFKPKTTNSGHNLLISPNLLKESGNEPHSWGEVIVGDITYLPVANGKWCYLAMWQDKLTRDESLAGKCRSG